jgi:hypothetical protein
MVARIRQVLAMVSLVMLLAFLGSLPQLHNEMGAHLAAQEAITEALLYGQPGPQQDHLSSCLVSIAESGLHVPLGADILTERERIFLPMSDKFRGRLMNRYLRVCIESYRPPLAQPDLI